MMLPRRAGLLALAAVFTLLAAGCGDETLPSSAGVSQDETVPQPNLDADGLALRIAGSVDGDLLCPGDRRPCLPFEGAIDVDDEAIVWVAGRLNDSVFTIDDQRPLPDQGRRVYDNRCPDQDFAGQPSNEILESLYEDENNRPAGFVDLWDSDDGVLHMGIFGEPGPAEAFLEDLGIADHVCLVTGYPYADAVLEAVQFAANDAAAAYGFENYGSSRDSWDGTVTVDIPRFDEGFRTVLTDLSAANDGVPILAFASVEVVNGSLADYDERLAAVQITPDASQQLQATCGAITFSALPPDLDEFPPLDADAQAAIDELVDGPTGVEAQGFGGDTVWSIASRSDDELVLFGRQPDGMLTARFKGGAGAWMPSGWGGCRIQIEAPGLGPASIATDPAAPPAADDTVLALLITEQQCASGQAPVDREVVVVVTETDEQVTVVALVAPVEGGAECPSNPQHPIEVVLDEPLGDRELVDGHVYPSRPITADMDN